MATKFAYKQLYFLQSYLELYGSIMYGAGFYIVGIEIIKHTDRFSINKMDINGNQFIDFEEINKIYNRSINNDENLNIYRDENFDLTLDPIN